jgi:two-component system cell cycle sensor histidine kinase/response regulator CckA
MSYPGLHERVIFMPTGRVPAMTADIDNDPSRQMVSLHEPPRRGSIVLVLLVAGALVAAAVVLMTIGRTQAQPYILGLLALLAMVGLFGLFAFAAGIIRFADRSADDPVISRIADRAFDGLAVTDPRGHMVYFNEAYLALTGAVGPQDVRPVERVFIGNPDVSEAVFRLLKAAREGKRQQEEVRIAGHDGAPGRWRPDQAGSQIRGVVDFGHHPRPRAPGGRV